MVMSVDERLPVAASINALVMVWMSWGVGTGSGGIVGRHTPRLATYAPAKPSQ